MKKAEFQRRLKTSPRPIIVDLWAPWCAPCRAMEPAFKQASAKYTGKVDVLKINADESPDVLNALGVRGIPTVVAFANEKEIMRRTGMQTANALEMMFEAAVNKRKPAVMPPAPIARVVRTILGAALIIVGWFTGGHSIVLMVLGVAVLFSAFYDRCPIYRAVVTRVKSFFQRSKEESQPS